MLSQVASLLSAAQLIFTVSHLLTVPVNEPQRVLESAMIADALVVDGTAFVPVLENIDVNA